ncbi:MAG: Carbonic anhydrase 1 [Pseudomonadota bacterium]
MDSLIDGYRRFRARRWPAERQLYESLAENQKPKTFVISCCDSRVDPATIFNARPGELFVARNVANLVPPFEQSGSYHGTSAAIEFAVTAVQVERILVLGHARCGGVAAALSKSDLTPGSFLSEWIKLLDTALVRCENITEDRHTEVERESVRLSLERLRAFPFVAEAIRTRGLQLQGAHFGIIDGKLEWLDPVSGRFEVVD